MIWDKCCIILNTEFETAASLFICYEIPIAYAHVLAMQLAVG
jgi:hypothetical protein